MKQEPWDVSFRGNYGCEPRRESRSVYGREEVNLLYLAQGPIIDVGADPHAVVLLVVGGEVLE